MRRTQNSSRITLGLAIDWSGNPYQIALINGVTKAAGEYDINLVLYTGGNIDSPNFIEQASTILYDYISSDRLDGLIITGSIGAFCSQEKFTHFCRQFADFPLVTITTQVNGIPCVSTDNNHGLRELLLHLIHVHKYKNFAFIKGPDQNWDGLERLRVFREVLMEQGIPVIPELVFPGDFKYESGINAVQILLAKDTHSCDVIVAANDDMARGVMDALRKHGISVPRQIAVTGYDDQVLSQFLAVPLTTVTQPIFEQGWRAAELVISMVNGEKNVQNIVLPTRFVCRNSCGCRESNVQKDLPGSSKANPVYSLYTPKAELAGAIASRLKQELNQDSAFLLKTLVETADSLIEAVQSDTMPIFLEATVGLLTHPLLKSGNAFASQAVFLLLRRVLFEFCADEKQTAIIEHLFCEAALHYAARVERDLSYSRIVEEKEIHSLHISIQEFVGILDMEHLAEILTRQLPGLGITTFFLSLYEEFDEHQFPWLSRLVFAFSGKSYIPLPAGGEIFQTRQLYPEKYFPGHKRFVLELEGIFFSNRQLGFCIFEFDTLQIGSSWDKARRTFMVVALKAALYVQKVQLDFVEFEKKVKTRNEDLLLVNTTLSELYKRHKKAEEELRLLNEELENRVQHRTSELASAYNQLQETFSWLQTAQKQLVQSEKMAALGSLVAGVAHEINTPLGIGVTAASHLEKITKNLNTLYLNRQLKKSELEEYITFSTEASTMVLANLTRAHELISNFKKIAADQSSEEKRQFNVMEYIRSLLFSLKPQLKKTEHTIELEGDAALVMHSYPGALARIITNFIMNSLNHAFPDNFKGRIIINFKQKEDKIVLRYFDNGRGIEKRNREKIYEPFFTTNRQKGATGLGLYLVYNLVVNTFHGTIQCISRESAGTLFKITIPPGGTQ